MRILKSILALSIALQPFASHAQDSDFERKFLEQRANQTFKTLKTLHNLIDFTALRANEVDKAFLAKLKKNVSNRALPSIRRDGDAVYFSGHETPFLVKSARPLAIEYKGNSWTENSASSLEEMLTDAAKAFLKDSKNSASLFTVFSNEAHAASDDWDREFEDLQKRQKKLDKDFEKAPAMIAQGILATILIAAGGIGLIYAELAGKALGGISLIIGFVMFPKSAIASDLGTAADGAGSFQILGHECKKDRVISRYKMPSGLAFSTETVVNTKGHPLNYSFFFAGDSKPKYQYFFNPETTPPDWKITGKSDDAPDQSTLIETANAKAQKGLWETCKSNGIGFINETHAQVSRATNSSKKGVAPSPAAGRPREMK
jgi:hypothetical protein